MSHCRDLALCEAKLTSFLCQRRGVVYTEQHLEMVVTGVALSQVPGKLSSVKLFMKC